MDNCPVSASIEFLTKLWFHSQLLHSFMSLQPLPRGSVEFTRQVFYLKKQTNRKKTQTPPPKTQATKTINQNPSCILEENQLDTPNWDEFSMQKNNIKQ